MPRAAVTREMYIPENAVAIEGVNAVAYTFVNRVGKPSMLGFKGRAKKPNSHFYFSTEEARDKNVADFLAAAKAEADAKTARRDAANQPHTMEVGAILYSSWGYEQTNVTFYEVVEVPSARYVVVEEIGRNIVPSGRDSSQDMSCYVVADPTNRTGNTFRRKVDTSCDRPCVAISRFETAWVMEDVTEKKYCSWYA